LRARLLDAFLDPVEDRGGLVVTDRQRLVGGAADEAHHLRRFLDQVPALAVDARDAALVVGGDLHQHVAGEELALGTAFLAGAHFHHFLGRHQHVAEALFHAVAHDPVAQRLGDGLLEARVGVHHVPALVVFRLVVLRFHRPGDSYCPSRALTAHWMTVSKPAMIRLINTTTPATTQVSRVASWRVGQTTLRSSTRDSARNSRVSRPLAVSMNTASAATSPPTTAPMRSDVDHWFSNQ